MEQDEEKKANQQLDEFDGDYVVDIEANLEFEKGVALHEAWVKLFEAKTSTNDKWIPALENLFSFGSNDRGQLLLVKLVQGFQLLDVQLSEDETKAFIESFDSVSITIDEFIDAFNQHDEKHSSFIASKHRQTMKNNGTIHQNSDSPLNQFNDGNISKEALSRIVWGKIIKVAVEEPYLWDRALKMLFVVKESGTGHGNISVQDMCDGLMWFSLELSPEEIEVFKEDLDTDEDKMISFEGFKSLVKLKANKLKSKSSPSSSNPSVLNSRTVSSGSYASGYSSNTISTHKSNHNPLNLHHKKTAHRRNSWESRGTSRSSLNSKTVGKTPKRGQPYVNSTRINRNIRNSGVPVQVNDDDDDNGGGGGGSRSFDSGVGHNRTDCGQNRGEQNRNRGQVSSSVDSVLSNRKVPPHPNRSLVVSNLQRTNSLEKLLDASERTFSPGARDERLKSREYLINTQSSSSHQTSSSSTKISVNTSYRSSSSSKHQTSPRKLPPGPNQPRLSPNATSSRKMLSSSSTTSSSPSSSLSSPTTHSPTTRIPSKLSGSSSQKKVGGVVGKISTK